MALIAPVLALVALLPTGRAPWFLPVGAHIPSRRSRRWLGVVLPARGPKLHAPDGTGLGGGGAERPLPRRRSRTRCKTGAT
jgi:hypothetical protein